MADAPHSECGVLETWEFKSPRAYQFIRGVAQSGKSARLGTGRPEVQILAPRPLRRVDSTRIDDVRQEEGPMSSFDHIDSGGVPIKAWTRGVPIEDAARKQIENVARLPFIHRHVAIMPDVHWGKGATVGSVIPTIGAIIPAAVGVDIGCGTAAGRR